jgi:hypothetical protein
MGSVHMTMRSMQDWSASEKAQAFVEILVAEDDYLLPQKIDNREPERFLFNPNDLTQLLEIWTSDTGWLHLKRRKPYLAWMIVRMWPQESRRLNEIMSGFDQRYLKKAEGVTKLLSCAKRLYQWGTVAHSYICHEEDWNFKNYFGAPTLVAGGRTSSTGGLWLESGLPGIYWANFFGPLYVAFFGREKFQSVPAYYKEELPDGGVLLLTAPSPLDYGRSQVHALEEAIIDHLGREAFFEKRSPQKPCRTPQFTFLQGIGAASPELTAHDPVVQAIPEPQRFIHDALQLAAALTARTGGSLDYSPESLQRVDDFILQWSSGNPEPWTEDQGHQLLQELTAYYGEVVRRHLSGEWCVFPGSGDRLHPAVVFRVANENDVEYPFTRIVKLWSERERADGLAVRYHLLCSGQLQHVKQYLKSGSGP